MISGKPREPVLEPLHSMASPPDSWHHLALRPVDGLTGLQECCHCTGESVAQGIREAWRQRWTWITTRSNFTVRKASTDAHMLFGVAMQFQVVHRETLSQLSSWADLTGRLNRSTVPGAAFLSISEQLASRSFRGGHGRCQPQ